MLLIGVQPVELDDYGGSLRPIVKARIDDALRIAVERLAAWGCEVRLREMSAEAAGRHATAVNINSHALALDAYESGRPSAEAACRIGDARYL
jgi:hydrogenase maturation protease